MRMLAALACVFAGCASANLKGPGGGDDVVDPPADAPDVDPPDSPPSGPVTVTLAQTTSPTIAAGNTRNCNVGGGATVDNHYYRVFPLTSSGISNQFQVTSVSFGVENAVGAAGASQTATLNVGTYAGTIAAGTAALTLAQLSAPLGTATATIPDGDLTTVTTPVTATIPAGSNLYVEIHSVDAGNAFYPGSNNGGESIPGFIKADTCGTVQPGNYSTTVAAPTHLILTVTGTH